ncbi:MAG: hypothetical protein JW928_01355 [Candidatus Aureabacteria bacterium]|nr:hypothetical protein [Candidatus Auribacterota bacterium]
MKNTLQVHLVQFSIAWEDQEKNYRNVLALLGKNPPAEGSVVCLPELFSTGYTMRAEKFAENLHQSPTLRFLSGIAQFYECFVIGSLIIRSKSGKPTNSALALSPEGKVLSRYDKIHLLPLGKEHKAYKQGNRTTAFKIKGKLFSILVCYDLRFPELFRILYEKNVSGIFLLANWPAKRHDHWEILTQARAVENQCYLFCVNRTGRDPHHRFKGESRIIDPFGRVLSSSKSPGVVSKTVDIDHPEEEKKRLPFYSSRAKRIYKKYPPYNEP